MAEYDCRRCKMWKGCPGQEWYDYGEIRWCPHQVIWIVQNAGELDAGIWPEQSKGHSKELRAEAYFVNAKLVISEVKYRLDLTDNQGELLVTQIEDGRTLFATSSTSGISNGAFDILMYVKGRDRKAQGFHAWQRKRKYNMKMARNRDKNGTLP